MLSETDNSTDAPKPDEWSWRLAFLLAFLGVGCAGAVGFASARHTGSLAFPIDDGYIYSNYVLNAAQGNFFTYNPGETSGGITGLGWYVVSVVAYWLLAPFHALLGGLAPADVRADPALAQQAGHLYLAAYLPGLICLALTAMGVYRLAWLCLPLSTKNPSARNILCWLLGAVAAADLGLLWGAMSGLEVALSAALSVWAIALLVDETRKGRLRWSLVLVAFLPWARPDLLAISFAGLLWLLWRAVREPQASSSRRVALASVGGYLLAMAFGLGAMSAIYLAGWGRPLPGSFYAKVGGLRLSGKFFSAAQELLLAGRYLPFMAGLVAVGGGLAGWLLPVRSERDRERASSSLLLLLVVTIYTAALMATLPWFGQEDRYLMPLHPFVIVLVGLAVWRLVDTLPLERLAGNRLFVQVGCATVAFLLLLLNYLWATQVYSVEVRNIDDAHIKPALWIAANTPGESVIASEPIGAVRLFSGRRTVDLVGLTTPATLGTYRDWPRAWDALHAAGATWLLYYPDWFDGHKPPAWTVERQRFAIPDNRIAGADVIAVYELDWSLYTPGP